MSGALPTLAVLRDDQGRAPILADALQMPCIDKEAEVSGFLLEYRDGILNLRRPGDRRGIGIDWVIGSQAWRRQHRGKELLLKAVGKLPADAIVLDATAGLGGDTLVLAQAGFQVVAVERHPVVHALLVDALARAAAQGLAELAGRIDLQQADAMTIMQDRRFDTVYLDPMFPGRDDSAAVRKPLVYLQGLLGVGEDEAELLQAALSCATRRVVVKRPLRAPALSGPVPDLQWKGKAVRFDVYTVARR